MPQHQVTRRAAIARLLSGAAVVGAAALPGRLLAATAPGARLSDGTLTIDFDAAMASRLSFNGRAITPVAPAAAVRLVDGRTIDRFTLLDHAEEAASGPHGAGRRHRLRATAQGTLEQQIVITFLNRYPGLALIDFTYRNTGTAPLAIAGWRAVTHDLLSHQDGAWSFAGASYPNRRDWVQPVAPGFEQHNFMGMNGSDYGGGTPVAVVWRRDVGLAVGHVDTVPRLVSLPVAAQPDGTRIGMSGDQPVVLAPGATFTLPPAFVMAHRGDHFRPLDAYRRLMAERGLAAPAIPASSYGPIWCAWGYERNYTPAEVYGTLPKAKELGFEWAVLDDGWQTSEGDWKLDPVKYPNGDADMRAFVKRIKADGMRPRLWLAPLAADPGTDLLRDRPDMLLLDRDGAAQNVSWWSAFTLCPAYQPTVDHFRGIVRRIIADWGFEGLKLDGQHLNGVAPCYNPAHKHARPEESYEKLQDFWKAIYDEAIAANPQSVVEICPCGDSFAFHNIPAMNNTPASDPESSWQVRLKGKTFKALMGPSAPYSGDHVELSEGGDDFASTYGIGAIPSTKFTWPKPTSHPTDTLPPGGFVLTSEKEKVWRHWLELYRANRLAEGTYLGGLYDLGFDKPEGHAVAKNGAMHYAFYAKQWDGPIELRGLGTGSYALADAFTGRSLGRATAGRNRISATFERFMLVTATPVVA
ncbi:glycoside hydrolase family 36 protein [Sphingomonas aerophila]|uniref:Alpha-galactosidase n=1 Tax=Sphingomonas aerophila TaxID=1344948 RepID=A0A7W9EVV0_9SPHN|nr:glycoside hydrolase family 36 protein [Sphingomonas aerophila]MBB5716630.1 alpha-galactosidase [Sphingomonas aerophila]